MNRTWISLLLLTGVLAAPPLHAQSWLERATGTLEGLTGGGDRAPAVTGGAESEIAAGLKEALRIATERTVDRLGTEGGFNADPAVHIPLPETLARVQSALEQVGMGGMAEQLELRLNRAAEAAAPEAREVFVEAIRGMTLEDARGILNGPQDAASQYLRRTMSDPLKQRMRPIVDAEIAEVGAIQVYDRMKAEYANLPFVPDVKADLTDHTLDEALDGIFHYLGKEEARIRADPAARTTDLLKKVFGG